MKDMKDVFMVKIFAAEVFTMKFHEDPWRMSDDRPVGSPALPGCAVAFTPFTSSW
jgi:hypothetical protein